MRIIAISMAVSFLAAIASCTSASAAPPSTEDSRVLREDWIPALEQICGHFEEKFDAGLEQYFSAACQAWSRDAQMLVAYVHLWQWLEAGERTKLLKEQDDWNRGAHEEAAKAGKEYEGGSLESILSGRTYAELALKRTRELRLRLKAIRGAGFVDPGRR